MSLSTKYFNISATYTTSGHYKAFNLQDIILLLSLLLLALGCEGCILFLLLGLQPTVVASVKFTLDQVPPQHLLLKSCPHLIPVWQSRPAQDALDKGLPLLRY